MAQTPRNDEQIPVPPFVYAGIAELKARYKPGEAFALPWKAGKRKYMTTWLKLLGIISPAPPPRLFSKPTDNAYQRFHRNVSCSRLVKLKQRYVLKNAR